VVQVAILARIVEQRIGNADGEKLSGEETLRESGTSRITGAGNGQDIGRDSCGAHTPECNRAC
jgi:predicted chitinase